MTNRWKEYYEFTKGKPPRSLLIKALPFVKDRGDALDVGAGALNDSKYLLEQGFRHVDALDKEPVAQELAGQLPKDMFEYVISDLETYDFPKNKYDLVSAQYSIPFVRPSAFKAVFSGIIDSAKNGGILAAQLFGNGDEWEDNKNMNFHTLEDVKEILKSFETLYFEEEDKEKPNAAGKMKHWHLFHFIIRK